jgi:hypothetical protein
MSKYDAIADGAYIRERRNILRSLGSWKKMTDEEKQLFERCHKCKKYNEYAKVDSKSPCPCMTCEHRKTELQVDNKMTALRRRYLEEDD